MMTNASKLGSLIAEAVADAAQRVLSGKWADEGGTAVTATSKPVAKRAAPRKTGATRKAPAAKAKTAAKPKAKRAGGQGRRHRQAPVERRRRASGRRPSPKQSRPANRSQI